MSWVTQLSLLLFRRIFHNKYLSLYLPITKNWSSLRIRQWNPSWRIEYYLFTYFTVITKLQKSLFWACPGRTTTGFKCKNIIVSVINNLRVLFSLIKVYIYRQVSVGVFSLCAIFWDTFQSSILVTNLPPEYKFRK